VDAVLKSLFRVGPTYTRETWSPSQAHPAFFGRYFHLCIPQGDIPQTELLKLLRAISKPTDFKRQLAQFDKQRLALQALTRLSAYTDQFSVANVEQIKVALGDVADAILGN
jgi:hypothetical protein